MELKNMISNNFGKLLINSLKEKKNWFLISIITIFVTTIVIPMLLVRKTTEFSIAFGIFELFVIVFLNCVIDFNYLHDPRKFSYYMSKPITNIQKINIILLTNILFSGFFIIILGLISYISGVDMSDFFIVSIPWMLIGIFLCALSSLLSGNSIVAGLATIFNFLIPLSILAIVYYIFYIIETVAAGFNADILMNTFVESYYKIENLYFVKYANEELNFSYFLILIVFILIIYYLIIKLSKRRKNERIGEFIVFDGYKNFIAILLSTLVPIAFLISNSTKGFLAQILSFIILASLAYYIVLVVLEKSFKLSKSAFKILIIFMGVFIIFVFGANLGTKKFEGYVPSTSEISSVYVGRSTWVYSNDSNESIKLYDLTEDYAKKYDDIIIYKDSKNIESFLKLHKEIINNKDYFRHQNIGIVYNLKNGKNVVRYYSLEAAEEYDGQKDKILKDVIDSSEYKKNNLKFIYDSEFSKGINIKSFTFNNGNYGNENNIDTRFLNINKLRYMLQKDYSNYFENDEKSLETLLYSQETDFVRVSNRYEEKFQDVELDEKYEYKEYSFDIEVFEENSIRYYFNEDFTNTINYLEIYLKK